MSCRLDWLNNKTKGKNMKRKVYTIEEKKAYFKEKSDKLKVQLDTFLKNAIENKDGFEELAKHYRISGLYQYSFKNSLMIVSQGGTIAQSYDNWTKLNRYVKKEQKSYISVFTPFTLYFRNGVKISQKEAKKYPENEIKKIVKFNLKPVFDVSQTDGEPLQYDHNSVEVVSDTSFEAIKKACETLTGAKVIEEITGFARGWSDGKVMAVSSMSNNTDKVKTLLHEVAHHIMHTSPKAKAKGEKLSGDTKEVEAESVSYMVLSMLGIDYSLADKYVASYKQGINDSRSSMIIKVAENIRKAIG